MISPGALERKICNSSVEPTPSRISTPNRDFQLLPTNSGSASPADVQTRNRLPPRSLLQRLIVEHRRKQRRHAEEDAGIVAVHQREHGRRRRALGVENRGGADRHRKGQGIAEAIGEKQFRRRQSDIVLADAEHLFGVGLGGGGQARMQMPHALGHAGRARRIQPEGRFVGMRRHRCKCIALARDLVGEFLVPVGVATGNNDMLEIRHPPDHVLHHRQQRFGDEQHPGAAIRQHIGVLIRRQQRVERHRHHPGADRAEKHHREIDGVEHDHGDALFAADAETAQHVGDAAALLLQRAVGQFGNRVGEGELAAAALIDIAVEQPTHGIIGTGGVAHAAPRELKRVTTILPRFKNYNS